MWPDYWANRLKNLVNDEQADGDSSNPLHFKESESDAEVKHESFRISSPYPPSLSMEGGSVFFQGERVISQFVHHLLIMLTFGLASPPLMVSIVVTCWVTLIMWKVILGRFYSKTVSQTISSQQTESGRLENAIKQNVYLQQIEKSLENVESAFSLVSASLLGCSALFVGFLCYDMVGNDPSSPRGSLIAIPLIMVGMPLLLRFGLIFYSYLQKKDKSCDVDTASHM